jgi:hypothetical protein
LNEAIKQAIVPEDGAKNQLAILIPLNFINKYQL